MADPAQERSQDQDLDRVKDIFAPAKGLERNKDGKIQIDKEKVEERPEPAFEKQDSDPRTEELKREKEAKGGRTEPASAEQSTIPSPSPAKPRMTLMERQAAKDAEKRAQGAASATPAKDEKQERAASITAGAGGGLKAPSRLARPTAAAAGQNSGLKATEERKQKLLEKQKAVNARMEEKAKATADKGAATGLGATRVPSARGVQPAEGGAAATRTSAARSRLVGAVGKVSEEAKTSRLTAGRKSISGGVGIAIPGRLGAGRASVRPSTTPET